MRAPSQTLALHEPGLLHYVLVIDARSAEEMPAPRAAEVYVPLEAVVPDEFNRRHLTFFYSPFELSCALKPLFILHLLAREQPDVVVYLDSDMTLHASLPEDCLPGGDASIVLTPHWLTPTARELEARWLKCGAFNAGYFAVRNDAAGREFLDYWWARCQKFAVYDFAAGLFVDQAWLNLVPALFPQSLKVSRHAGVNVSWWNLHERGVRYDGVRAATARGQTLALFHWSQLVLGDPGCLFRFPSAVDPASDPETPQAVAQLHSWYSQLLGDCRPSGTAAPTYIYGAFADGTPIALDDRCQYRQLHPDGPAAQFDPFSEGEWFRSRCAAGAGRRRRSVTLHRLKSASARLARPHWPARVVQGIWKRACG